MVAQKNRKSLGLFSAGVFHFFFVLLWHKFVLVCYGDGSVRHDWAKRGAQTDCYIPRIGLEGTDEARFTTGQSISSTAIMLFWGACFSQGTAEFATLSRHGVLSWSRCYIAYGDSVRC